MDGCCWGNSQSRVSGPGEVVEVCQSDLGVKKYLLDSATPSIWASDLCEYVTLVGQIHVYISMYERYPTEKRGKASIQWESQYQELDHLSQALRIPHATCWLTAV